MWGICSDKPWALEMQTAFFSQSLLSAEVQRSILWKGFFAAVFLSSSSCPFLLTIDITHMIACKRDCIPSEINYHFLVLFSASVVQCTWRSILITIFLCFGTIVTA